MTIFFLDNNLTVANYRYCLQLAQWAGSRRDLFPDILCDLFGRLHSNGKPHTLRYTKRVLEKAFKRPFKEIFLDFDEKPMGIGAVAQVNSPKLPILCDKLMLAVCRRIKLF